MTEQTPPASLPGAAKQGLIFWRLQQKDLRLANPAVIDAPHIEEDLKSPDVLESANHLSQQIVRLTQGQSTHKS